MIVNVSVTCPDCASLRGIEHIDVRSTAVHLTLFDTGRGNYYSFFCPRCFTEVTKPANDDIVSMLLGYVRSTLVRVPGEIKDGDRTGPPLTVDDVMDFVVDLYRDGGMRVPDAIYFDSAKRASEYA